MTLRSTLNLRINSLLRCGAYAMCSAGAVLFGMLLLLTAVDDFVFVWRVNHHETLSAVSDGVSYFSVRGGIDAEVIEDQVELGRFNAGDRHILVLQRHGAMRFGLPTFRISLWWPFAVFAAPLVVVISRFIVQRWVVSRRSAGGRCARCGYDLHRNESGVCPECGVECKKTEQLST